MNEDLRSLEQATKAPAPARPSWAAPACVWTIWGLALLLALVFVGIYGHDVPRNDDLVLTPFIADTESPTVSWLWVQYGEHRLPLPKLILVGILKLGGGDFRAGMFLNVLALAGLAVAMIGVAKRMRGWTSYTDAFFPLVLLHLGHGENFLWCWQVVQIVPTVLAGALLVLLVRWRSPMTLGFALPSGLCLLLLSVSGPPGMAYVPLIALGLCGLGWFSWRAQGKWSGLLLLVLAAAALLMLLLYFVDYTKFQLAEPSPGLKASLRTAVQFLSLSFGFRGRTLWPFSGLAVLLLGLASSAILVLAWYRNPRERVRILSLLLFLTGIAALAAGVGWGRAGWGNVAGFALHYVSFTVPALCCCYFAWDFYSPPTLRLWSRLGLVALAGFIFLSNIRPALHYGNHLHQQMASFEEDMRNGVPLYMLVHRYRGFLGLDDQDYVKDSLQQLQQAGVGPFRYLRPDPPFREVSLPVEPTSVSQMSWADGTGHGTGRDSSLLFSLPRPMMVAGIRITYVHANQDGTSPPLEIEWKRSDQSDFPPDQQALLVPLPTEELSVAVYPCETISQFRIRPDAKPFQIRITKVVLLVPEGEP